VYLKTLIEMMITWENVWPGWLMHACVMTVLPCTYTPARSLRLLLPISDIEMIITWDASTCVWHVWRYSFHLCDLTYFRPVPDFKMVMTQEVLAYLWRAWHASRHNESLRVVSLERDDEDSTGFTILFWSLKETRVSFKETRVSAHRASSKATRLFLTM